MVLVAEVPIKVCMSQVLVLIDPLLILFSGTSIPATILHSPPPPISTMTGWTTRRKSNTHPGIPIGKVTTIIK